MKVFDLLAERYDGWYEKPFGRSVYQLECECLKDLVEDPENSLEVGVGTGRFASRLGVGYGVDTSERMLRIAKGRGVRVVLGRAENLPLKTGRFRTVLFIVTLCFVEDPELSLKEAFRVLSEGGAVVLGLILRDSPWAEFYLKKAREGHPIYRHAKFYSFNEVKELLEKTGFIVDRVRSTLMEEPQDRDPVRNRSVVEGLELSAGFTCIRARKVSV